MRHRALDTAFVLLTVIGSVGLGCDEAERPRNGGSSPDVRPTDGSSTDTDIRDANPSDAGVPDTEPRDADAGDTAVDDASTDAGLDDALGADTADGGDTGPDGGPECRVGSDCPSGVCSFGSCLDPTCDDGVENGSESDVDCGGPACPDCQKGDSCNWEGDCESGICSGPDGRTCASCKEGETRETGRDCGYQDRGERIEVCRHLEWRQGPCRDVWYRSCLEIVTARPNAPSGTYTIDPDGPNRDEYKPMSVRCDLDTDGGGWTLITPCLAKDEFNGRLGAQRRARGQQGFDSECRPRTRDVGDGRHDVHFTFDFPPGFSQFYLDNYVARANSSSSRNDTSELGYKQKRWGKAAARFHGEPGHDGDISFGVRSDRGPITSFSRVVSQKRNEPECEKCTVKWKANGKIFDVGKPADAFRIGWGEAGPQSEGWYPWYRGGIWLR